MTDVWVNKGSGTRQREETEYAEQFQMTLGNGESLIKIEEREFTDNPPLIIAHVKDISGNIREVICANSL